jgi:TonB family protein
VKTSCARAEILAGALALGEATPGERDEYRLHIASCRACLSELGGEREIERVMSAVAQARSVEIWEPAPVSATVKRSRRLPPFMRAGFSVLGVAVIASVAVHFALAWSMRPPAPIQVASAPESAFHVTLEAPPPKATPPAALAHVPRVPQRFVVVHNVITLKKETHANAKAVARAEQSTVVAEAPPAPPVTQASNVPVWRRDAPLPVAPVVRSTATPVMSGHAEAIAIVKPPVIRESIPVGGDAAINPQPPPLAYAEEAEGTTAFEVQIDPRGFPIKCTITKASGFPPLDNAVCHAAMRARYEPRTVNGHPTVGLYRDAFTFRLQNDGSF